MTSDGFGRWAVPSARDLADVLNMVISSNHSRSAEHDYIIIYYPVLHCKIAKNSLTNEVYC